jgi:hypothetical protein
LKFRYLFPSQDFKKNLISQRAACEVPCQPRPAVKLKPEAKINEIFIIKGKGNTDVPGFEIPPVENLLYGQTVSGTAYGPFKRMCLKVPHFFKITIF